MPTGYSVVLDTTTGHVGDTLITPETNVRPAPNEILVAGAWSNRKYTPSDVQRMMDGGGDRE